MKHMKGLIAGLACFIFFGSTVFSQSIYSAQGIGSLNSQGNPNNFAMGGLGIGTPTTWNINTKNPAYLVLNPFSTFEIGLSFDKRNFKGEGISESDAGGGLNFLAYAFPIKPNVWSSSVGILPYSTVNYDAFSEGSIEGAPNNATYLLDQKGEGGLTNFFWSNAVAVNKNLSIGLKSSFIFGSIQRVTNVLVFEEIDSENVPLDLAISIDNLESYKGFDFELGIAYRVFLSESSFLNVGLTASPKSSLNVSYTEEDSVVNTENGDFMLPKTLGMGVSYQKLNSFSVGLDVETQSWKDAHPNSNNYDNSLKMILGGSWTPDYNNVNSYLRRIRYSMGFNYQKSPYIVNNQGLTEFGINFGASLPVSGYSSFDLAFKMGQLGETSNGLIKETYFKVVIGATINDRWFIKRKYD